MKDADLVLHYNLDTLRQAPAETATGHASVRFKMLTGADDMAISEAMLSYDDAGRAKLSNAAAEAVRLQCAVEVIDGLHINGREITTLDADTYAIIPRWMIVKMRMAANLRELDPEKDPARPE